jgi:RHS repeat-associated protein
VVTRFVNAGGLCLQERNSSNSVARSYAWDGMSPGGIGGLLELSVGSSRYSYLYDGEGNVGAVLNGSQGVAASYGYDPFGVLVSQSGTLEQPYRFSTKPYYGIFGGVYYGYRFDLPALGRWMTRDPLGEAGGLNLYGFAGNAPMNWVDPWGLHLWTTPAGGNRPHHHDPKTGVAIAGWEDEIETDAKGWNEGMKNGTYNCFTVSNYIISLAITFEYGSKAGLLVLDWFNFLLDYAYGKPASIPHIPIPDIVNPPNAEGGGQ